MCNLSHADNIIKVGDDIFEPPASAHSIYLDGTILVRFSIERNACRSEAGSWQAPASESLTGKPTANSPSATTEQTKLTQNKTDRNGAAL